jgi:enterochelin esterase-like enzyme
VFLIFLVYCFAGLGVLLARSSNVVVQVLAGTVALAVGTTLGVAVVNRHYHYYDSWSSLYGASTDNEAVPLSAVSTRAAHPAVLPEVVRPRLTRTRPKGAPGTVGPTPAAATTDLPTASAYPGTGTVVSLSFAGTASGLTRKGYVYLPPQYNDPKYANDLFPVVELLHGDPGDAAGWLYGIHVRETMDQLINSGQVGPMVLVMPTTFTGAHGQSCLDALRGDLDETYLTQDVPQDVVSQFRVPPPGPAWGVAGLSDGGFCAANLALRHPQVYAASGVMDGYFTPLRPRHLAARLFGGDMSQVAANDPTLEIADPARTLPKFWIMAGTTNHEDYVGAQQFVQALSAREPSYFLTVEHGDHTAPAWRTSMPSLLSFMWNTLSGGESPTGASTEPVQQ